MTTRKLFLSFLLLLTALAGSSGAVFWRRSMVGISMTSAATKYLAALDQQQRQASHLPWEETKQRVDWHFIPKDQRKGLQIKQMNGEQRKLALLLLRTTLSQLGYDKASKIMAMEGVLRELEKERTNTPLRDPERYYFTLFGDVTEDGRWGLSIEGHHLSLNFVIDKGDVVSSTPTLFAANPAIVMAEVPGNHGIAKGTRLLEKEETAAFDLVGSLSDQQKKVAIIDEQAPKEIRAAGEPQPPADPAVGISYGELSDSQKETMKQLVGAYLANMPDEVRQARLDAILAAGPENVKFCWAGPTKPGVGHYYRVQGPTFLIEFVNTQPDAAGNPANHIHSVWRDMRGDFALPIK